MFPFTLDVYAHVYCVACAGHFQVVLVVDNQETTTKSMFRGILLKELSRYGQYAPPVAPTASVCCHKHMHGYNCVLDTVYCPILHMHIRTYVPYRTTVFVHVQM